jgi:hypothetical protein
VVFGGKNKIHVCWCCVVADGSANHEPFITGLNHILEELRFQTMLILTIKLLITNKSAKGKQTFLVRLPY